MEKYTDVATLAETDKPHLSHYAYYRGHEELEKAAKYLMEWKFHVLKTVGVEHPTQVLDEHDWFDIKQKGRPNALCLRLYFTECEEEKACAEI